MRKLKLRFRRLLALATLFVLGATLLTPQTGLFAGEESDSEAIVITGSGYMQGLLENMLETYIEANALEITYRVSSEGSGPGFDVLCSGEADANMATQTISDAQVLRCTDNGIDFVELILGVDHAVLAVDDDSQLTCLPSSDFTRIFRRNEALTLDRILDGGSADETVTVYGPSDTEASAFTYLRATFLNNVDPSLDEVFEAPTDIADALRDANDNGIALMSYAQWETLDQEGLRLLNIQANDAADCVSPTPDTLSTGDYPASRLLYLYANANSVSDGELALFLNYHLADSETEASERPIFAAVRNEGFEPPVQAILDRNIVNYTQPILGRTFTRTDNPALVNTAAEGTLTVAGSALSSHITTTVFTDFAAAYELVEIDFNTFGDVAAWEAFCNGEVNVIQVGINSTAPEDCDVRRYDVTLGADGVVFLTGVDSTLPVCLDYQQIASLLVRNDLPVETPDVDVEETTEGEATDNVTSDAAEEGNADADAATPDEAADSDATDDGDAEATPEGDTDSTEAATDDTSAEEQTGEDEATEDGEELPPMPPAFDDPQGPTMWSEIAPEWAAENDDLPIIVLVPGLAALETDLITSQVSPGAVLRRTDQPSIREADPRSGLDALDYRSFSAATVEGAITYMRWSEYQQLENRDELRVIEIQATDSDCVTASAETLLSGDYPFTFSAQFVFAEEALSDALVASLLWHTYDRDVLTSLAEIGLAGFERVQLDTDRETVFALLEDTAAQAAEEEASADTEGAVEGTPDAETDVEGDGSTNEDTTDAEGETEGSEIGTAPSTEGDDATNEDSVDNETNSDTPSDSDTDNVDETGSETGSETEVPASETEDDPDNSDTQE